MSARLIKGREAAAQIMAELERRRADQGAAASGRPPRLTIFTVGNDPAARQYLRATRRAAEQIGVEIVVENQDANIGFVEFCENVTRAGASVDVDAVQVLKPIPEGHHVSEIMRLVPPVKDVEGVHPENLGLLLLGRPRYVPCTAAAVMALLDHHEIQVSGLRAVVVGRSDTVGKPLASLMLARSATVTVCHSVTADLEDEIRRADILIAAIGRPELIRGAWIKPGSVVVDLGHHVLGKGRTVGDVEASAIEHAGALTPVPGGAGPLTVAVLMSNVVAAAQSS